MPFAHRLPVCGTGVETSVVSCMDGVNRIGVMPLAGLKPVPCRLVDHCSMGHGTRTPFCRQEALKFAELGGESRLFWRSDVRVQETGPQIICALQL